MKIRIRGNKVRYRLTRSEVARLADIGFLEEKTDFGNAFLTYAIRKDDKVAELEATFEHNTITLIVPSSFANAWPLNDTIGIENSRQLSGTGSLNLLLEKDFVCLDHSDEDQTDNYANPNKAC